MVLNIQLGDIGLVIDLFGAVILFFFGLAPLLSKDGSMSLSTGNSDYLKRKANRYETLSRLGVLLVFIGFILQLLSNHVQWSTDISLNNIISIIGVAIIIFLISRLALIYRKRRYDLSAWYIPQFDEVKFSRYGKHMWCFTITNNSKRLLKVADLFLSDEPSKVIVLFAREAPHTKTLSKKITLEDIQPRVSVIVHVWGMGGHKTAGLDCYLEVDGKIIRPRVMGLYSDEA